MASKPMHNEPTEDNKTVEKYDASTGLRISTREQPDDESGARVPPLWGGSLSN